jgi:hypothetical protein
MKRVGDSGHTGAGVGKILVYFLKTVIEGNYLNMYKNI